MKEKKFYREWSEELFQEREYENIFHDDSTISFVRNCEHIMRGIVVLLAPNSKEPCVFCANCGGWIATLRQWQEWDQEHREIYKDPFRPRIQLTFSTADRALRSFWDSEPIEGLDELLKITFLEPPRKKARGLFRNLGKKITKAMRENEERDEWYIWNEIKELDFRSMYILPPSLFSPSGLKGAPLQDFRILEKEEEEK